MNSIIDDITLLKYINKGVSSEIFLSKKKGVNELMVTKRFEQEKIRKNPIFKKYLENAIFILNNIKHPNIIRLYDVKSKPDYVYITMEYCNGGSLHECFQKYKQRNKRPFTEDIVRHLVRQILLGIKCLHDHKIIHRDIKLGNILVKFKNDNDLQLLNFYEAQVKITDLKSCTIPGSNLAQTVIGTVPNMAPSIIENYKGNYNIYDEKVDIWSLGTVCYEMLVGNALFNNYQILHNNINDLHIDIPNFISSEARSFLLSMLQKDSQKRLSADELLRHPFINKVNNINIKQPNYNNNLLYGNNIVQQQPQNIQYQVPNNQYQIPINIYNNPNNNIHKIQDKNNYQMPIQNKQPQVQYQQYPIPNNINNQQNPTQYQVPNYNNQQINYQINNNIKGKQISNENKLDYILLRLTEARHKLPGTEIPLKEEEIKFIINKSLEIIKNEKILLDISAPINICGDIHGQFYDLLRIFEMVGYPDKNNYLFLGNYVDFGKYGINVLCLLLCYKIKYPNKIYLLRGNHECSVLSRKYGFYDECKRKFNSNIWRSFLELFNFLPVAAVIDDRIFCVHGGLSPELKNVQDILSINRPTEIPETGLLCDLLNSDPDKDCIQFDENDNGISVVFGEEIVYDFLKHNNLELIVRGNQPVFEGYEYFANKRLITIFSAPCFKGEYANLAGILIVNENLTCSLKFLRTK